jgi:hypothetical protein
VPINYFYSNNQMRERGDGDLRGSVVNLMKNIFASLVCCLFFIPFFDVVLLLDLRLSSAFRFFSDRLVFPTRSI